MIVEWGLSNLSLGIARIVNLSLGSVIKDSHLRKNSDCQICFCDGHQGNFTTYQELRLKVNLKEGLNILDLEPDGSFEKKIVEGSKESITQLEDWVQVVCSSL